VKISVPKGACDTHMHFYDPRYPTAKTALMPGPAWANVAAYRKVQAQLGIRRVVIVQPTSYGTDNGPTLDALATLGADARAIAVVDRDVSNAEFERLTRLGCRGARFQILPGGAIPWEDVEATVARIAPFGWHAQVQMNGRLFPEREAVLRRLPCDVVIDHVGRFMDPVPVEHPAFKALLGLLDTGRCWVKLSAPYESSKAGPPDWADVRPLARALAKHAPERMLWASDWPHPSRKEPPDDGPLLDLLLDWVDDDATRRRILVDNPAELYGFPPP
jgi:D-galactarolactone isomerase